MILAISSESNPLMNRLRNVQVALYGTSKLTETFIDEHGGENISGILDGYKVKGDFCGINIIKLTDCVMLGIGAIIICARKNSANIISSRISGFCKDNKILLYDMQGNDLLVSSYAFKITDDYHNINEADLINKLSMYDVISFDIFDTLLCRKTLYPTDVLYATDEKAKRLGIQNFLENRLKHTDATDTLVTIYNKLYYSSILSKHDAQELLKFEYDFDNKILHPREKMRDIFNIVKNMNKQIYLVSDTWYDKQQLKELIKANGYTGYTDIITSCEYNITKASGLFEKLRNEINKQTCIHIGDDHEVDGIAPNKYGIDSFLIKSPTDMLTVSVYHDILRFDDTYANRLAIGLFVSKLFNNPFALYKSEGISNIYSPFSIGYLFIGPIISSFVIELARYAKNKYEQILFLSRDSFLAMKMYRKLTSLQKDSYPTPLYFLTSRIACVSALIETQRDLEKFRIIPFEGNDANLFSTRFSFMTNDTSKYSKYELIVEHSKNLHANYQKYAEGTNLNNSLIVDFVAEGTCQSLLSKIFNKSFNGYYFMRLNKKNQKELNIDFYTNVRDSFAEEIYMFLENIIGATTPSLKCFNKYGEPLFFEEKRSSEVIYDIKQVQDGAMAYFNDYITIADLGTSSSFTLCDTLLSFIKKEYTHIPTLPLFSDDIYDEFTNRQFKAFPR